MAKKMATVETVALLIEWTVYMRKKVNITAKIYYALRIMPSNSAIIANTISIWIRPVALQ